MAQKIHEVGCEVMSNKVPSKKTPSSTDILVQSQIEIQRVNTVLLSVLMEVANVADLDTNTAIAMAVTKTLVTEDVCPWLYSPSDEVRLVEFLNKTCLWVDRYLTELGVIQPHNSDNPHRRWISTSTTFFQARSGVAASSKTSRTGARKPDVTLVTNDSHEWSDVKSVIDVKYSPLRGSSQGLQGVHGRSFLAGLHQPSASSLLWDFGLALDFLDDSEKASEEKKKWTTTGTFPYSSVNREHPPNICHDLESFIFLIFVLGVNIMGPYHQLQDWPVPVHNTDAIETGISTTVDSANLTAKKFKHSNAGWATAASPEFLVCSCAVPQWAKFGISNFQDDEVIMQKENLMWDAFERSLDPYWKVGNMMAIWKKIYNLLWPFPAEKCWGLTHAKLINVL
ncbi:uncharacterized protein EDB91DRAFT_1244166 [Suillus paluster]|uniref:uncharacterized protein n=1 Tax=Suillus paluster TaxID=48578 RepID=UPI001B8650DB|nr:uncharacterized protein EDB91DRAFT_1244166 [Suillus paluster]KAG1750586.1 hypothetical protein EDB91DRAFT_1244166 [Suillus paluster]